MQEIVRQRDWTNPLPFSQMNDAHSFYFFFILRILLYRKAQQTM